jgi:hypothetical protein
MLRKKLIVILILCALCGWWVSLKESPGFSLSKIRSPLQYSSEWEITPPSQDQKKMLDGIFSQTFYYLGGGAENYAFISCDQQYVIKFFKMKHFLPKRWLRPFKNVPFLQEYYRKKYELRQQRLEDTFSTYRKIFHELPEETGLVYIHLNKTRDWKTFLTCIDKHQKKHVINLDEVEFIVQKKADLIYSHLKKHLDLNEIEQAKTAIDAFLAMIHKRCTQGFFDLDHGVRNNFGFVYNKPMQIDLSGLRKKEQVSAKMIDKEIERVREKIEGWLKDHYPTHFETSFSHLRM